MSFTGIFKAKNGIVAVVDSKASRVENGQSYEDVHRNPEKLFVFQNGIATTFGANQILVQNPFEFSSKVIAIEDLVYEYLHFKEYLRCFFLPISACKNDIQPSQYRTCKLSGWTQNPSRRIHLRTSSSTLLRLHTTARNPNGTFLYWRR